MAETNTAAETIIKFNNILKVFLNELCDMNLKNNMIKSNKDIIDNYVNKEKEQVLMVFIKYVLPYYEHIQKKDENFFLNHDFQKEIKAEKASVVSLDDIFSFKKSWNFLENSDKEKIFNFMNLLCLIAFQYNIK